MQIYNKIFYSPNFFLLYYLKNKKYLYYINIILMGKKIYITESQMKNFTRNLLRENAQLNFIEQFIQNIEPIIDFIEVDGKSNGEIGLIYKNQNNEEISIYINFTYHYTYEGEYRSATYLTPEEHPDFIVKNIEPVDVSLYIYTSNMEKEMDNISLTPNSTFYNLCAQILNDYEENIYEEISNNENTMSYSDYMDDMRERSIGI